MLRNRGYSLVSSKILLIRTSRSNKSEIKFGRLFEILKPTVQRDRNENARSMQVWCVTILGNLLNIGTYVLPITFGSVALKCRPPRRVLCRRAVSRVYTRHGGCRVFALFAFQ